MNRQTGRTTQQIKDAPLSSIYVWPFASSINYAKRLALDLGRDDILIIPESGFRSHKLLSRRGLNVVIDHATKLTREGWEAFRYSQYELRQASRNGCA